MKDKNQLIGFLLIGVVFFAYMYFNKPTEEELARQRQIQDSIAQVKESKKQIEDRNSINSSEVYGSTPEQTEKNTSEVDSSVSDSAKKAQALQKHGLFATSVNGKDDIYYLENNSIKLGISSKGGKIISAILKNYKTNNQQPLELVHADSSDFYLSFYRNRNTIDQTRTTDYYFEKVKQTDKSLHLRLKTTDDDKYLDYIYEINDDDGFLTNFKVETKGLEDLISSNSNEFELYWEINALSHEKNLKNERASSAIYYKYLNDDPEDLSPGDYEKEALIAPTKWISFKQQFFSSAIIANKSFGKTNAYVQSFDLGEENTRFIQGMRANTSIPFEDNQFSMQFYLGPNHYQTLKKMDIGMESQIELGWPIIRWVSTLIIIPTFNFLNNYITNYGIIILLLTIFIKMLLIPITYRNYKSSAKMKLIKPELDAINKKYEKKDALEKQQATMALYRKTGVSPFAGCIPMLIQMPILFAMFRFFPSSIELRQESFLWADDLSSYDSVLDLGFSIPFYGNHVSLFAILMAISVFLYSKFNMNTPGMGAGGGMQAQQMKLMMYLMPFMMLFFFNSSSSGLSYYYFAANMISILQQVVIKKYFINEKALLAKIEANKQKSKNPKKSGFQKRLEDMAKQRGYKR